MVVLLSVATKGQGVNVDVGITNVRLHFSFRH
jgi:hypothetical protein